MQTAGLLPLIFTFYCSYQHAVAVTVVLHITALLTPLPLLCNAVPITVVAYPG